MKFENAEQMRAAYAGVLGKRVVVQFRGNMQLAMCDGDAHRLSVLMHQERTDAKLPPHEIGEPPAEPADPNGICPAMALRARETKDGKVVMKKNPITGVEQPAAVDLVPTPAVPLVVGTVDVRWPLLELTYASGNAIVVKLLDPDDVVGIDRIEVSDGEASDQA